MDFGSYNPDNFFMNWLRSLQAWSVRGKTRTEETPRRSEPYNFHPNPILPPRLPAIPPLTSTYRQAAAKRPVKPQTFYSR